MAGTDPFPSALVPPDIAQMEEDNPIAEEGYQDPTLLEDMAMEPPSADLAAQTPVAPPPESGPTVARLLLRMEVDATERLETRATQAALGVLVQRLLTSKAAPSRGRSTGWFPSSP